MVCKVAPKISSPSRRGTGDTQNTQPIDSVDYETALDFAGYGPFSRSALGACALAFFTTGVENCVMSYVLPAAKCELKLTTYMTGLINMAFMSGGVASAFFWGIVADVLGRRNILSTTLILNGILTLAQSTVANYKLLLAARTVNGFLIGGPSTLVFTYLSDLVGNKRRQLYLTITGMSFVAAWLILPAVAWLVIPFRFHYVSKLPIYSWRLYLALCSVPAFAAGIWTMLLPESPRLLSDTNRSEKALKILERIHTTNKGRSEAFKIKKILHDNAIFVEKSLNSDDNSTKSLLLGVLNDLKLFVSKTYAFKSGLILLVFFANMSAGFGLNFWIPELLQRTTTRDCGTKLIEEEEDTQLFNVSNSSWSDYQLLESHSQKFNLTIGRIPMPCVNKMDDGVFISGLIVGAVCVIGNAACAVLCSKGGARGVRAAATACALVCVLAIICLALVVCSCSSASMVAVAAAAALNAASLNGNVLLIRLLLHALPPKLSGLGVCWGAWWGRAGGVASNFAVGALLDYSCPAPFVSVAVLLTLSIGAIMMIKLEPSQVTDSEKASEKADEPEKDSGLDRYISTHM